MSRARAPHSMEMELVELMQSTRTDIHHMNLASDPLLLSVVYYSPHH